MSKITKKDLNERLLMVETLLGLHRALPEQISNDQANNAIFRMQCALSSGKEIAGRNPTEVEQRIEALEEFATYADNMLTELNHALPDPEYDAKCEAQEVDIDASLDRHRERLGLNKPQLKQLDQSVFNGLDEKWKSAATNTDGKAYLHNMPKSMMYFNHSSYGWCSKDYDAHEMQLIGDGFDPSGFAVGFIERDTAKELTGSEDTNTLSDIISDIVDELLDSEYFYSKITCELLRIGCSYVLAYVSDVSEQDAIKSKEVAVIDSVDVMLNDTDGNDWKYAVPINNQGEPLTASEVGL